MTRVEKVAVSLPKKLVHRAEVLRNRLGLNRSVLYRMALKTYIEQFPGEEDKKLAHLYREIDKTDKKLLRHFRRTSYKHLPPYQQ